MPETTDWAAALAALDHPDYPAGAGISTRVEILRGARAEIERLRSRLLKFVQHDNNCAQTGKPCRAAPQCGCHLEAEAWHSNG